MLQTFVSKIPYNNEIIPKKGIVSAQKPGLTTQGKYTNDKEKGKLKFL